jgi:hypothetical protein
MADEKKKRVVPDLNAASSSVAVAGAPEIGDEDEDEEAKAKRLRKEAEAKRFQSEIAAASALTFAPPPNASGLRLSNSDLPFRMPAQPAAASAMPAAVSTTATTPGTSTAPTAPGTVTTPLTPKEKRTPLDWVQEANRPRDITEGEITRSPQDWARLFREQETNGTNGTNAPIPGTAAPSPTTAASTGAPPTGKKPFDWDIVSGFPDTEQEMTAGGQGYIRDANGAMALSSEKDKQGRRVAYEPNWGQSRRVPAGQMGFAGEIRGPVEQRDFSIIPLQEASPEAQAASEELRGRADEAHEARNVIGQARQMALADVARHEKDHAAFRQEHGIYAQDFDTPGEPSDLLTPMGRPKKQKDYLEWAKRQDEEFVNQRRKLQEQTAQLDQHYGMAGRTRERFLQESQSVLERDKAERQGAYEKQLAYTTAVKHKEAEELRANAAQADEKTRKESERAAKEADKEAKDAEKERAQLERRRAADQRRDLNDQEDATKELKGLYERQLKDFETALEKRGKNATGRGTGSAWTPALGAPDPANAMYKGKKAQFDQDKAAWERYAVLKKKALETAAEHEQFLLAKTEKVVVEGGGNGRKQQDGQDGQIAMYSKDPEIEAEAQQMRQYPNMTDEKLRAAVKKAEEQKGLK